LGESSPSDPDQAPLAAEGEEAYRSSERPRTMEGSCRIEQASNTHTSHAIRKDLKDDAA
jgi:hypothetical protein